MSSFNNAVGAINEICQKYASFNTVGFSNKPSENGITTLFVCDMKFSGQNCSDSSLITLTSSAEGLNKKLAKNLAAERLLKKMRESDLPIVPPYQQGTEDRSVAAEREKEIAEIAQSRQKKEMESIIKALKEECSAMIQKECSALNKECSAMNKKVYVLEEECTELNEKFARLFDESHGECETLTVQNEPIVDAVLSSSIDHVVCH